MKKMSGIILGLLILIGTTDVVAQTAETPVGVRYVKYAPAVTTLSGEIRVVNKYGSGKYRSGSVADRATPINILRTPYLVRAISNPTTDHDAPFGISEIQLIFFPGQFKKFLVGSHVTITGTLHEELGYPALTMKVTSFHME